MTGDTGIIPTMPMAPAGENGMGGGSWIWIILIFLLLGGRGGFGGGGDGVAANGATNLINNDFLYSQQKIDNMSQNLNNIENQITGALSNGFNSVNSGICNIGHQLDLGFCGVNRSIDQSRFEAAQNTGNIINAMNAGFQRVLDSDNAREVQALRDRILEQGNTITNQQQTAGLINALRPYPQAAYITVNPNAPFGYPGYGAPFGYGANPCSPC